MDHKKGSTDHILNNIKFEQDLTLLLQEFRSYFPLCNYSEWLSSIFQSLPFICMLINDDFVVGAKTYKIKGLFNHNAGILVFLEPQPCHH